MTLYSPTITSKDNPTIKTAHALLTQARQRKKLGQTVLEGTHLIEAYLNANLTPNTIIISEGGWQNREINILLTRLKNVKTVTISDSLYKEIRSLGEGLSIMAIIDIPSPALPNAITSDCLIINGVQDNGNLGTLLRTASAVGVKTIICTADSHTATASAWSPKTLRAGMGANFGVTIYEGVTVEQVLEVVKVPLFATSSHTDTLIYQTDLTQPLALIMGHEGQGVDDSLMSQAIPIALPQPNGQESLNVAIAGALCMYEVLRQRHYV
ncbi:MULTISPECIES: TrmH family RNA methyltransferase [unclassified Moraxella]|uniref:TrmH family RNA methyltransferase n=1 Tax=unclassified Moraxella TaxID=2685852 RepID=UPI003AF652D3